MFKKSVKRSVAVLLTFVLLLTSLPVTTFAETTTASTETKDEYIYYSDLFYAYPHLLSQDSFLNTYNSDLNYVCTTIYNNYNNSAAKFGTIMERTLEVITSPADLTKQITDTLGLTNFDKNKAYDKANQKFVKHLLNTPASDSLQSAYGKTGDIAKKTKSIVKMFELSAEVDENKSAEQYLLDITYSLWEDGILSNLSTDTIAKILEELDASGTTLNGIFGLAATEIEIAQSFVIALMMEDIRMEIIDEMIDSQSSNTILKEGMTRLKKQLSGGFVTYFISNYISGKLLDEVLNAVGDIVYTAVGAKLISDILSIAEKIVFDILLDEIPSYGEVLAYQVLMNYSNCLYSAIQAKANSFIGTPLVSNEISKYESLFTAYVAANNAAFEIVAIFVPYEGAHEIFREAVENGIEVVTINGEEYSSNLPIVEIDNILLEKLLAGQLVLTIDNGISKEKIYNKAEAYVSIFADSLSECKQIRADFTDKYRSCDIFRLHVDSAKSQISGEPTVNWTYEIDENTTLRVQSDTIEPDSIYAYNNKLLGNTNINGNINITFPLEVMGDMCWNNTVNTTFKICSDNTLRVNGDFSLSAGDPGYGKTSYSYFTVESGAKLSVGKNFSVEGHTAIGDGMGYINTNMNGDVQIDGNLNINDITNTYMRGYLNVNGDFNQTASRHALNTTSCKVWVYSNAKCLINGDFNLKGAYYGNVDVNWAVFEVCGGIFEVKGNFNATDRFVALKQTGSDSQWIIRGDAYIDVLNKNYVPGFSTGLPAYTCNFTAGTLIIGGDFNSVNSDSPVTFTNAHTVIFNGAETQTITNLKANNLTITNTSSNGVCFSGISYVTWDLNTYTSKLVNGENLIVNGGRFVGDTLDGDISVQGNITFTNDIKINGSLYSVDYTTNQIIIPKDVSVTIGGNANFKTSTGSVSVHVNDGAELSVLGNLVLMGKDRNPNWQYADIYVDGNLFVGGNLSCSSCYHFYQTGENSYTIVQGNLTFEENGWFYSYKDITAGTVAVRGKVHNYEATNNNVLLLNGTSAQRVTADSVYTHKFGTVASTIVIENTNGVNFSAIVTASTLFDHKGNTFTLYNNGTNSVFVDYDGDGLKDNVDPHPTIHENCVNGHKYSAWKIVREATPYVGGIKRKLCVGCGDEVTEGIPMVESLAFKGASLTLHHNLAINYKVDKALFAEVGYTNPYVVFQIGGIKTTVKSYTVDGDRYVFKFRNIAPNQMNDTIYATLYATYNGVEYASETREYSVAEYCYSTLNKYATDDHAELRTLLVDLLHYGAQSQLYTKYNVDNLVNANLTEAQLAWGTAEEPTLTNSLNTEYETVENPLITWKGASLNLNDSVSMRFKFIAEDVNGLSLKITSDTDEWNITSNNFVLEDGVYSVRFSELNAGQMSEKVYLTMYKDGVAVSNTVCYSIESYAYSKQDSTIEHLSDLVKAMMKYGNSAHSYVN